MIFLLMAEENITNWLDSSYSYWRQ